MKYTGDLAADVRRLSRQKKGSITPKQLFSSPAFQKFCRTYIYSIVYDSGAARNIHLTLTDNPMVTETAFTNGENIVINTDSCIASAYTELEPRFNAVMGMLFHELGHILFLDFQANSIARKRILYSGKLFGEDPILTSEEEKENFEEVKEALKDKGYRELFAEVYHDLMNYIADAHDEAAMIDQFGSFVERCISTSANSIKVTALAVEDMEKAEEDGHFTKLQVVYNMILQMVRFGEVHMLDPATNDTSSCVKMLNSFASTLVNAQYIDSTVERYGSINKILINLWPFIKEEAERLQEEASAQGQDGQGEDGGEGKRGQGQTGDGANSSNQPGQSGQAQANTSTTSQAGNSSGNQPQGGIPQLTPEQVQSILNQLAAAQEKVGGAQAPENRNTASTVSSANAAGQKGKDNSDPTQAQNQGSSQPFQTVLTQVASAMAENEIDKEVSNGIIAKIQTVDATSAHAGIDVNVSRPSDSASRKDAYMDILQPLLPYSKRLQRGILNLLKDMRDGYTIHHRLFGRELEVKETYRPDQRAYMNRKLPQDVPDMAVAVLIDCSGSMSGLRMEAAQKAAILLHDFCLGIGVPVHIAGHKASYYESIDYTVYTDFDAVGDKDRYRLMALRPGGCNRDGLAICKAAGHLAARPEEIKLLIVISDGQPNHASYGGEAAIKDIQEIVLKAQRKGVETIGAAIGSDKDVIKSIYKDNFLDITDLSTLPKDMIRLVSKRVIPT